MNNKVLVFGGGTGMSCLLKGLKQFPVDISAVVSVCDDGGSTGILRDEFDILAVGDIRKVLISLSETESSVEKLLNYRFKSNGGLNTHTVGNILITAATEMTGTAQHAIELLGKVLDMKGTLIPFTESNVTLCGEMEDGSIIRGEHHITKENKKIKRVFYEEEPVVSEKLLSEIAASDLIVLSMGSVYTSLLPCLISDEVREAIDNSNSPIVYICNLFTQPGETDDFKVSDHINVINQYLGKRKIDVVISNVGAIDKDLANKYLQDEQKDPVILDAVETAQIVDDIVIDNLVTVEDNYFRHDSLKLGYLLFSKLLEKQKEGDANQKKKDLSLY